MYLLMRREHALLDMATKCYPSENWSLGLEDFGNGDLP